MIGALLVVLVALVLGALLGSMYDRPGQNKLPSIKIRVISVLTTPITGTVGSRRRSMGLYDIEIADNRSFRVDLSWPTRADYLTLNRTIDGVLVRRYSDRPAPKTFAELERERVARETRLRGPIHGEAC